VNLNYSIGGVQFLMRIPDSDRSKHGWMTLSGFVEIGFCGIIQYVSWEYPIMNLI